MPPNESETVAAAKVAKAKKERLAAITRVIKDKLGLYVDIFDIIKVHHVFDNNYRVNVIDGKGIVHDSYFIEATEDGIISSDPPMVATEGTKNDN